MILHPLTAAEVHARSAGLSPQIRSGLFIPGDHWVDNERLMRALLIACQRAGVRFEAGHAVHKFHTKDGRIAGVAAEDGASFTAKTYVLAAGCWSGEVAGRLGIHLPITPCRGQMMEFESPRELPFVVRAGIHYLVPRPERRVLLGTTAEYTGFEKAVTAEGLLSILQGTVRLSPRVGEFRFLRAWAGLRPDTADHLPILGYGEIENLVFATGHFRNGILLAPVTAEIIADLILKGSTSRPIEAYRPTRFTESGDRDDRDEREEQIRRSWFFCSPDHPITRLVDDRFIHGRAATGIARGFQRADKGLHNFGIELRPAAAVQLLNRLFEGTYRLVSPLGNHGIKAVGHGDNAGAERDILTLQSVGITRPIEPSHDDAAPCRESARWPSP